MKLTGGQQITLIKGKAEEGKTIHKCSVCGCHGIWSEGWEWYGGWDEECLFKVCSSECKSKVPKEWMKKERRRREW